MQESGTTILFVSHDPAAIKALCSRTILLNNGRIDTDGKPSDVLNRYQGLIMEREEAYDANEPAAKREHLMAGEEDASAIGEQSPALRYSYRHGDGSAEILSAELINSARQNADLVETAEPLVARLRVRFHSDIEDPCFGFLIRNRHGIHAYGANSEQKEVKLGIVKHGEIVEVSFAFNCSLGTDLYSVSFAVHSEDGISYDWLDGVLFFRVTSASPVEGIANLNATASVRRLGRGSELTEATRKDRTTISS
jgi:lipopolysaccharide transport system ATP-binding protein